MKSPEKADANSPVLVEKADGVTSILLNRPRAMNAIDTAMHHALEAAFDDYSGDPGQRVCVVRGVGGRAFCAGSDLKDVSALINSGKRLEETYPKHGYAGLIERFDLDKPVIAAVDGVALGGGFEIALACDLIIATDRSRFGLPEPLVGGMALGGGVHRLARQIGLKHAMGMILTGRLVDAPEAGTLGFVNEVVPADALDETLARWIELILRCSPAALAASKQAVMWGLEEQSIAQAIRRQGDYPAFRQMRASPDSVEGAQAFIEKRKPRWA